MSTSARALTVLECAPGKRLAKLIHADGRVEPYDGGWLYLPTPVEVPDLGALAALLEALSADPGACVVRGALKADAPTGAVPRRMHDRQGPDGAVEVAAFEPCARAWMCVDLDASTVPAGLDAEDMRAAIATWRATLPECLRAAGMVFQLSAKAGLVPYLRGHAWFLLADAIDDASLKAWLGAHGFDDSECLANAVHAHYTAAPLLADDAADPWPFARVYAFEGPDVTLGPVPAAPVPTPVRSRVRAEIPASADASAGRIARLAEAVRPAYERGGRVGGNALLNFFGWALGPLKGFTKADLAHVLALLDEPDAAKRAEHEHILGNAVPLDGPGAAREWLGDEFDAVDAVLGEAMAEMRTALDAPAVGAPGPTLTPVLSALVGDMTQPFTLSGANGQMWIRTADGYAGPYAHKRMRSVAKALGLFELVCLNGEGKLIPYDGIYDRGSHVERIVRDFAETKTRFDLATATLFQGYVLPAVAPVQDERVAAWLRTLAGENDALLLAWLRSCAQDCIARKAAALVLVGRPGAGKTLVFTALARLWGAVAAVPLADSVAQFNSTITRAPIVLDDECACLKSRTVTSAEFRARVQARARDYEPKGKEKVQLLGCTREGITANDLEEVRFADVRGSGVVDALRDRLLVLEVPDAEAARRALAAVRGSEDDDETELARIVGHLAWLWATTPAPTGERFLGAGGAAERVALASAAAEGAELWDLVRSFLDGPPEDSTVASPLVWRTGVLYAWPSGLAQALDALGGKWDLGRVQRTLASVRGGERTLLRFGERVVRYWPLRLDRVRALAGV